MIARLLVTLLLLLALSAPAGAVQSSVMTLLQQSQQAAARGQVDQALEMVDEALRQDPAYLPLWNHKAALQIRKKNYDGALETLAIPLKVEPGNAQTNTLYLQALLRSAEQGGGKAAALNQYLSGVSEDTGSVLLLHLLTQPQAKSDLTRFLSLWKPTSAEGRAIAQMASGYAAGETGALRQLSTASASAGRKEVLGALQFYAGKDMLAEKRFDLARSLLERAQQNGYDPVATSGELGWVYYNQGDPAKAADLWEQDWRSAPDIGRRAAWIADARLAAKDYKRASAFLETSLQFDPKNPVMQGQYLMALRMTGQDSAAAGFEQKLKNEGGEDGLAYGQALYQWRKGDYAGAAAALRRIKERKPFRDQFAQLANELVEHLGETADSSKAIEDVRNLIEGLDVKPGIMRDLGWKKWSQRNYGAAVEFWKDALSGGLAPDDPLAARIVPLLIEQGRTKDALEILRKRAPEVTPLGLAWSAAGQNRWDLVTKILASGPGGPGGAYADLYLALAHLQNGEVPQALDRLHALQNLNAGAFGRVTVSGFNADGRVIKAELTPAVATDLYLRIAKSIATQEIVDAFFFLTPPSWATGASPKALAAIQSQAGKVMWRVGNMDEAAKFLEAAIKLDAGENQARLYLALLRKRQGRGEEASRLLAEGLKGASPFDQNYVLGEFALLDNQPAKALEHFRACLDLAPNDDLMRMRVITLLVNMNRFAEARQYAQWYEKKVASGDKAVRATTAVVRLELGDPSSSAALYGKLLAENPKSMDYLAGLGRALNRQNRFQETVKALAPAYEASGDPALGAILCDASMGLGDYKGVVRYAEIGLKRNPKDKELLRLAAEASEFTRDLAACEGYARRYVAIDPDSLTMQNLLGRALLDQGKYPEAEAQFQAMLARNPRHLTSLRGLLSVYQLTGDAKKAYQVAKTLNAVAPDDAAVRMKYAIAAAADHSFRPAYPTLEKLRAFGPNASVLCLYYSDVRDTEAPGVVRLSQVVSHIQALKARGAVFLGIDDLAAKPRGDAALKAKTGKEPLVLIIVDRTSPEVLAKIDHALANAGGKATLVVGGESLVPGTPYLPDYDQVARLSKNGRWSLMLTDHNPPQVPTQDGRSASLWSQGGQTAPAESQEAMAARLAGRLRALDPKGEVLGKARPAFFYPGGNPPDELLAVDAAKRAAYDKAVADHFPLAFDLSAEGYWTPVTDPRAIPARAVLPSWDAAALDRYLDQGNPSHQVSLELAKVNSWHEQLAQADNLYKEAAALGVNPAEVTYNHAVNAYYEYDDPTAVALAKKAVELDPTSERAKIQLERAELRTRPQAQAQATTWWDSDNRRYWWYGLGGNVHILDSLVAFAKAGGVEWSIESYQRRGQILKALNSTAQSGTISAENLQSIANARHSQYLSGQDLTVGARWFFYPEYWVEVQGQLTGTNGGPAPWANFQATAHGPIGPRGLKIDGSWDLQYAYERIDTVEAISAQIMANRLSLFTHNRILDFWDLFLNLHGISRTDGNQSGYIDGRLLRRLWEFPMISLGYAFQFATSDRDPIEYWAPLDLATHLAYASFGYAPTNWFNFNGSVGYGTSRDRNNDWREVWRVNAGMDVTMRERLKFSLKYSYFSTPNYNLNEAWAGITYTFR